MFYYGGRLRKLNCQTSHVLSLSFSAAQNRAASTVVTLNDFSDFIMYLLARCAVHFLGGVCSMLLSVTCG